MPKKRIAPGPGQESVWDYPRPPRLDDCGARIRVIANGVVIADSIKTKRMLETSHPPVYYIPQDDVDMESLIATEGHSFCEWKGEAKYYSVSIAGQTTDKAAWCYPNPSSRFAAIRGFIAFYPSKVEACYVDEEKVVAQEGDFYGGWITSNLVGPFKGPPGTFGW